jgi:hypothetical protein
MTGERLKLIAGSVFAIVVGFFFSVFFYYDYETSYNPDPNAYYEIPVTLSALPEINHSNRMPTELVFIFKEYPGKRFDVLQKNFSPDYTKTLYPGDTVDIIVLKKDYNCSILKEGNVFERFAAGWIKLFGFYKGDKNFVNIDSIASLDLADAKTDFIGKEIFASLFFVGGILGIFVRDKKKQVIKKSAGNA